MFYRLVAPVSLFILLGLVSSRLHCAPINAQNSSIRRFSRITSAPAFVRISRAAIMTVRNEEYVEAARALGMPDWQIVVIHMLPNCISPLIVQATQRVASAIISASSLSFLGLGVPQPAPEWGSMLSAGRSFIRNYSYMTFFPGLALMLTVLGFNLLGDGIRDAIDPKLKR